MKTMKKITIILSLFILPLMPVSCLKNQADIFEESAADRMQSYLANVKQILEAPEYGWKMYVFPIYSGDPKAGFVYTAQFKDGKVTFRSERDGDKSATSYYALTGDTGPVISFDTYNEIFHYWSTPGGSSSLYQGRGGDAELIIETLEDGYIKVVGKRKRGIIEMYPLEKDAATFLNECRAYRQEGDVFFGVNFGTEKLLAEFYDNGSTSYSGSYPYRVIEFEREDKDGVIVYDDHAFVYLPDRIRFYKDVTYGGVTAREFKVDLEKKEIKPVEDLSISFVKPFSFVSLSDLVGQYTMTYDKTWEGDEEFSTIPFSLEMNETGDGLVLAGMNENWKLQLGYDEWSGVVTIPMQDLGLRTTVLQHTGKFNTLEDGTKEEIMKEVTGYPRFCYADYSYFNKNSALPYAPEKYSNGLASLSNSGINFRYNLSGSVYSGCVGQFVLEWRKESATPSFRFKNTYTWTSSSQTRAANSWYLHCFSSATNTSNDYYQLDPESGFGFQTGEGKGAFILPYVYSIEKK